MTAGIWNHAIKAIARTISVAMLLMAACAPSWAASGWDSNLDRLRELNLPAKEGAFTLYYSPSAKAEAEIYAAALEKALAWYSARIEGLEPISVAVLNAEDWKKVSLNIPYPSPHAELDTSLVLMPDRIDTHPGFDQWDLEAVGLNAALTFHEIGHVIAHQAGLWATNYWVNELVANIFLAAYIRAERPDFAGLLAGVPPRFTEFGRYTSLTDFDAIYYAMGALNYAWFQFKLAELADFMVTDFSFVQLIGGLRDEFPRAGYNYESVEATLARIENIRPGTSERAKPLLTESNIPVIDLQPCGPEPARDGPSLTLLIQNQSDQPLKLQSEDDVQFAVGLAMLKQEIETEAEQEAFAEAARRDYRFATIIEPNSSLVAPATPAGRQYRVVGAEGCFIVPEAQAARILWKGAATAAAP